MTDSLYLYSPMASCKTTVLCLNSAVSQQSRQQGYIKANISITSESFTVPHPTLPFIYLFFFLESVCSLCTHHRPAAASQVLGLWTCTSTPPFPLIPGIQWTLGFWFCHLKSIRSRPVCNPLASAPCNSLWFHPHCIMNPSLLSPGLSL